MERPLDYVNAIGLDRIHAGSRHFTGRLFEELAAD